MEPAISLFKENVMPVKRGRGRPRKESTVLKDQSIASAAVDLGPRDNGFSDQQPTLNLGSLGSSACRKELKKRIDSNAQNAGQKLDFPTNPVDSLVKSFKAGTETLLDIGPDAHIEASGKPFAEDIPAVKENRKLPPTGELFTKRIPAELVGDTLQVWEFLCRFSDVLGLTSPLTYEELETGLIRLGPPVADTISDVEELNSVDPRNREYTGKVCTEADHDRCDERVTATAGISGNFHVQETGVSPESHINSVVQGDDLKAKGSGFNKTGMLASGHRQDMSIGVEAGNLPQSTTVQEIRDMTPILSESLGEEVSATERAVAFADGTLNEHFVTISSVHILLLKLLLADLQFQITGSPNVYKSEEPKRKGRKPLYEVPQVSQDIVVPEFPNDLPINDVTWPELLRRYLITLVEVEKYGDLTELRPEERKWLLRCLQGDGGVPCGALYTVVGVESDAQVLAEAEKELATKSDGVNEELNDPVDGSVKLPPWVEVLKPVAKMATNVGSRIRIKVKEALELGPPEWARDTLEWSISKDVFKGNASGPTKKAVIEVLKHFDVSPSCESPTYKTRTKRTMPSVDQLMQRCRVVLRTVADADKTDTFSILIGGPEGHGSRRLRGMVARPLDFRTIDARLAAGAYGGSVDAFAEDVRQIWKNVASLQKGGEVMELVSNLSQLFEDLFQKQVLNFLSGISEVKAEESKINVTNAVEEGKENAPLTRSATAEKPDENKLQAAPWQDTDTCRVCGVDEDYESIMLCDKCDAEYHTYCLNPPLEKVPEGTWFCPECVALDKGFPGRPSGKDGEVVEPESLEGEEERFSADRNTEDALQTKGESIAESLLKQVELKEYWQLELSERLHMLKFLCDESLKTIEVRTHLEKSVDLAYDLQHQLSSLHAQRDGTVITVEEQGGQKKETAESLKSRSHSVKGAEASSVDSWSNRLRHHSSGVRAAEDITPALPRLLNFDADSKEDENSSEEDTTTRRVPKSEQDSKHDVATINVAIHVNHRLDEVIKVADASPCAIISDKLITDVPPSSDLAISVSATVTPKRKNNDVHEGEKLMEIELRDANAPERITTRNSKRAKLEEHNEDGQPEVEVTKVSATLNQRENSAVKKNKETEDNHMTDQGGMEAERVAGTSVGVDAERLHISDSPGAKNTAVDKATDLLAESGRGISLRSNRWIPALSSSSDGSVKTGIPGGGLPPRIPKRKLEMLSSLETQKKFRTDGQSIPTLGEVIDDPQRSEDFSDLPRPGPLQSPTIMGLVPSNDLVKVDAESIKLEWKLHNTTLRRDHLGTDDIGRHYWALSGPNQTPVLVVSECDVKDRVEFEWEEESAFLYVEQSAKGNDHVHNTSSDHTADRTKVRTRWWVYNTEASIDSLLAWLNPCVKVEQALKKSICHWRESVLARFRDVFHKPNEEEVSKSLVGHCTNESFKKGWDAAHNYKAASKRFPVLKATSILQMRYGSGSFSDGIVQKRAALAVEGRVIRCSCLEPLWKFKWHCQACHETYESSAALESHMNACPVATESLGLKKGTGKGSKSLTPEKGKKKTGSSEKGKKDKSATPKKEGTKRLLGEDTCVRSYEENSLMSWESSEPSLHRHATRNVAEVSHSGEADGDGNFGFTDDGVDDAFFLSDFQDDAHNPAVDDIETEDFSTGFGSFSSVLQDDEWEANLRPDRSQFKKKKHSFGKKSSKLLLTPDTSETALANFDYASLPMTFATPDSTRDRILQIGCIADQGPTFAPALHFAPAFDPSLMIQPCYPDPKDSATNVVEFIGSYPLPSSQNNSLAEESNTKDFCEGGLDAVSWYDPQTSGEAPPDVVFAPDLEDAEAVVHPGPEVAWDFKWTELIGLPKMEPEGKYVSRLDDGCGLDENVAKNAISNDDLQPICTRNTNKDENDSLNGELEPSRTVNVSSVETDLPKDELRPSSDLELPDLAPVSLPESMPPQNFEAPLETVATEAPAVVPSSVTMKKPSKKFAAPEPSLRPLVGEQYGVLTGLKMRLLDMEAALGADALIPSKSAPARCRAWRSLVKSAQCIYEMTKAFIILEQMVRADCVKRSWCHWSSLSVAARSATLSTLALRIFAFDSAVTYKKDQVIADDLRRPTTVKKFNKKNHVQVPLSSKKKKVN